MEAKYTIDNSEEVFTLPEIIEANNDDDSEPLNEEEVSSIKSLQVGEDTLIGNFVEIKRVS